MLQRFRLGQLRFAFAMNPLLEEFEPEPLPVHVIYPHSRLLSPKVRVFVEQCVETLRKTHQE